MNLSLKDIVKDNVVRFSHYRAGYLYYSINVDNEGYSFPVPISDVGDATFLKEDKAILLMRYIRQSLSDKTFVKI